MPLSVSEVRDLAAAMPRRNQAMVVAQAGLGLRIGELLALRAQDVDFLRRSVRIETQLAPGSKVRSSPRPRPRVGRCLSRRSWRMPLPVTWPLARRPRTARSSTHARVSPTGTTTTERRFEVALGKAGLPQETTSHDLRLHYASVLLSRGESVVAVAERLGHENANLVLSTYGPVMPDSEDRTRRAIDAAWPEGEDGLETASL